LATIARVAVEQTAYHFDKLYDYLLPPGLEQTPPGSRVTVNFGSARRSRMGLVVEVAQGDPAGLKPVLTVADAEPALDAEGLALLRWLKEQTYCTWFDALSVLLPAGYGVRVQQLYTLTPGWQEALEARAPDPEEQRIAEYLRRRRAPVPQQTLRADLGLAEDCPALRALLEAGVAATAEQTRRRAGDERQTMVALPLEEPAAPPRLTPKQQSVVDLLAQVGEASLKEVCYYTGVTRAVVDKAVQAGAARYFDVEVYRDPYKDSRAPRQQQEVVLSPEQRDACAALEQMLDRADPARSTALLFGVTGSGKTQVCCSGAKPCWCWCPKSP